MTIYFAFKPRMDLDDDSPAPISIYDPELHNPYTVKNAPEKINRALEALPKPPKEYEAHKGWVRFEYEPLVENKETIRPNDE